MFTKRWHFLRHSHLFLPSEPPYLTSAFCVPSSPLSPSLPPRPFPLVTLVISQMNVSASQPRPLHLKWNAGNSIWNNESEIQGKCMTFSNYLASTYLSLIDSGFCLFFIFSLRAHQGETFVFPKIDVFHRLHILSGSEGWDSSIVHTADATLVDSFGESDEGEHRHGNVKHFLPRSAVSDQGNETF